MGTGAEKSSGCSLAVRASVCVEASISRASVIECVQSVKECEYLLEAGSIGQCA